MPFRDTTPPYFAVVFMNVLEVIENYYSYLLVK